MEKELKKAYEHFQETHFNEDISQSIQQRVMSRLGETTNGKAMFFKRAAYIFGVPALLAVLLFGSASVSPTMAEIMSRIPYIQHFFNQYTIEDLIEKELKEQDINIAKVTTDAGPDRKQLIVTLSGNQDYYSLMKPEVTAIMKDVLKSQNYDAYETKVYLQTKEFSHSSHYAVSEETYEELYTLFMERLEMERFQDVTFGMNMNSGDVILSIPDSETRTEELKKLGSNILADQGFKNQEVQLDIYDLEISEAYTKWSPYINMLQQELIGKNEYHVHYLRYAYDSKSKLNVYTSLATGQKETEKAAAELKAAINEFLQSAQVQKGLKGEPYEISIYDKSKNRIM